LEKGSSVVHIDGKGLETKVTISKIEGHLGLERIELEKAICGDIVILSGMPTVTIGDTFCSPEKIVQLPAIHLGEPTVAVDITVNTSPMVGRSGKFVTINKLRERLEREKRANISLRIEFSGAHQDVITVAGRGELHLAVLLETMRREGFELSLSKPRVLFKEENGETLEPLEKAVIEVPEAYSGYVIEELSKRKGELLHLSTSEEGSARLEFMIPTRGLMGYRSAFLTATRGLGILTSVFERYGPYRGNIVGRREGVLISTCTGRTTPYAAFQLQDRGSLFVAPGDDVYEGMLVGESSRSDDITVNVTKEKHLTNVRAAGSDENIILTPPRRFTLEQAIEYIQDDELIEVTPTFIRLRKRHLTENERKRQSRN
jgi:GTP-binding protein